MHAQAPTCISVTGVCSVLCSCGPVVHVTYPGDALLLFASKFETGPLFWMSPPSFTLLGGIAITKLSPMQLQGVNAWLVRGAERGG